MSTKIRLGSVRDQQKNKRGWLVGQFMEGDFKDDNVEIYYKTFVVGDPLDKLHKHPNSKEYIVVLAGRAKFVVDGSTFDVKSGDYFAISGDLGDQLVEVYEELTILGVRNPSIPDNKVFL